MSQQAGLSISRWLEDRASLCPRAHTGSAPAIDQADKTPSGIAQNWTCEVFPKVQSRPVELTSSRTRPDCIAASAGKVNALVPGLELENYSMSELSRCSAIYSTEKASDLVSNLKLETSTRCGSGHSSMVNSALGSHIQNLSPGLVIKEVPTTKNHPTGKQGRFLRIGTLIDIQKQIKEPFLHGEQPGNVVGGLVCRVPSSLTEKRRSLGASHGTACLTRRLVTQQLRPSSINDTLVALRSANVPLETAPWRDPGEHPGGLGMLDYVIDGNYHNNKNSETMRPPTESSDHAFFSPFGTFETGSQLMEEFHWMTGQRKCVTEDSRSRPSAISTGPQLSPLQATNGSLGNARRAGKPSRKRSTSESSSHDNDPSEGEHGSIHNFTTLRRLACPYFKKNQLRYASWRACPGPGEHLYRKHALPLQCPRCYAEFTCEDVLDVHLRAPHQCLTKKKELREGVSHEQTRLLRRRKRKRHQQSDVEDWKEIWRILFPEDPESAIPSPYYEYDIKGATNGLNDSPLEDRSENLGSEITRHEIFLQEEVPRRVRQRLQDIADAGMQSNIFVSGANQIAEIVRDCQNEVFQDFRLGGGHEAEYSTSSPIHGESSLTDLPNQQATNVDGGDLDSLGDMVLPNFLAESHPLPEADSWIEELCFNYSAIEEWSR
ncbi:MAG: hypothetical protein M1820_007399 [Bogoriella megaspora]|nr:MAG: hypothetical protein M1820_007399 [Bogoriella megaspora]